MGSGIYFVHCVVLASRHITEPMGVNEASLNVDKYDNQNKVNISHQFLVSDCTLNYLMTINDAYSSKHVGLYKNCHKITCHYRKIIQIPKFVYQYKIVL